MVHRHHPPRNVWAAPSEKRTAIAPQTPHRPTCHAPQRYERPNPKVACTKPNDSAQESKGYAAQNPNEKTSNGDSPSPSARDGTAIYKVRGGAMCRPGPSYPTSTALNRPLSGARQRTRNFFGPYRLSLPPYALCGAWAYLPSEPQSSRRPVRDRREYVRSTRTR